MSFVKSLMGVVILGVCMSSSLSLGKAGGVGSEILNACKTKDGKLKVLILTSNYCNQPIVSLSTPEMEKCEVKGQNSNCFDDLDPQYFSIELKINLIPINRMACHGRDVISTIVEIPNIALPYGTLKIVGDNNSLETIDNSKTSSELCSE